MGHRVPRIAGEWVRLFHPAEGVHGRPAPGYTNDHTLVRDEAGRWHAFGIVGWLPVDPWGVERQFFHVVGDSPLHAGWTERPYALTADRARGERYLWAPYVIQEGERYHMFYAAGSLEEDAAKRLSFTKLCAAASADLETWARAPHNPLFYGPGVARDPHVLRVGDRFLLYYTRTFDEVDTRSCVAVRESPDLRHWSPARIAHVQPKRSPWAGDAESPTVLAVEGRFYLFVCLALSGYRRTKVYWSHDPFFFPIENEVAELETHAAEVLDLGDGEWAVTDTGWDRDGLYAAPLVWD